MELIYEIEKFVEKHGNIKFEIEYSAGENENEVDFECVRVSESNGLTVKEFQEIEKLLDFGLEKEIVKDLIDIYKQKSIKLNTDYKYN